MRLFLFGVAVACSISCASADEFGVATYYYNPWHGGLIAAHPSLPFGIRVRVYNLDNGREVTVVIVDRGPFARGRIIDISTVAADVRGRPASRESASSAWWTSPETTSAT
jgi:rare lipoprotein A (peptidoglycan hydrolase)